MSENIYQRKVRVAFQPLTYEKSHLAVPKELIIDYVNGNGYIKHENGTDLIELNNASMVTTLVREKIDELLDGVSTDGDTLNKLRELLRPIEQWMNEENSVSNDSVVDTIREIIDKFKDMSEGEQSLLFQINNKVDKVQDKTLSTNDFTNTLKNKLVNIEPQANKFIHSSSKVCNYTPIAKINNKEGVVVLNKTDISGLEYVDVNANKYIHPTSKQCTYVFPVTKINNRSGVVVVDKSDVGLGGLENFPISTQLQAEQRVHSDSYLTALRAQQLVSKYVLDNYDAGSGIIKAPLVKGDNTVGFYGEKNLFLTNTQLFALCNFEESTNLQPNDTQIEWLHFSHNGKSLLIPKQPLKRMFSWSWNTLNSKGLVYGKIININNRLYKCRLLTGGNNNGGIATGAGGEWNALMYAVHSLNTRTWNINYTTAQLLPAFLGGGTLCQDSLNVASDVIVRGHSLYGIEDMSTVQKSTITDAITWRPVLEKL